MEIIFYEIQTAYAADNYNHSLSFLSCYPAVVYIVHHDKNKQQPQDVLNMDTFAVLIFL